VLDPLVDEGQRFSGHLLDIVRCRRLIDVIVQEDLLGNSRSMGSYLLKLLHEVPKTFPEVGAVRGRGLCAAFDLPSLEVRDRVILGCFEEELLVRAAGERAVCLRPPIDVNADAIGRAVAQLEAGLRRTFNRKL
jgi:L-lysine 6-transaminase